MIKKFFREKYSTLLLIIGLTLSFFVAVNTLSSLNKLEKEQNKKDIHSYDIEYDMIFGTTDEGDEQEYEYAGNLESFINTLQCKSGNLFLYGYLNFIGDGFYNPVTYVALSINERFCENFIWGGLPDKESIENKEKTVIVSESLKEYVYDSADGRYIDIDGIPYKVTGMYESYFDENSTKDMDLCIFYNCLDERQIDSIRKKADFLLKLLYCSSDISENEFHQNFDNFKVCVENGNYQIEEINNRKESPDKNNLIYAKLKMNMIFMYVVLGFTLANCIMISDIWIKRRYNEFVIRRTYGYSVSDMTVQLIKDLLRYIVCALLAAVVLQTFYSAITAKAHIELTCIKTNVTYMLCMVAVILCVNLLLPICQVSKILPAQSIRKQKK